MTFIIKASSETGLQVGDGEMYLIVSAQAISGICQSSSPAWEQGCIKLQSEEIKQIGVL